MVQSIHLKQMQIIASQQALRYTGPRNSKVRGPMVLAYTPNTEQMQQWVVQLTEAVPGQHWQTCPSDTGNPPSHNSGWPTSE